MDLQTPLTLASRALKMYAQRLEKLEIYNLYDFLFHLPARYDDYSLISKINKIQPGETVTVTGQIQEIKNQYLRGGHVRTIQKAIVTDDSGSIEILWFNQPYLIKTLTIDTTISISGRTSLSRKGLSITAPDYEILFNKDSKPIHTGRLVPIYPETKGISSKWLRRQIYNILTNNERDLIEHLPSEIIKRNNLMDFRTALKSIHYPKNYETAQIARKRLSFDELFILQLGSAKKRKEWETKKLSNKFEIQKYETKIQKFITSLPFELTTSQNKSIAEIFKDLASETPMNRLLQGDVGSGKTIVAAIAMHLAHLNKLQSVLMAPTEILAHQHFDTISNFLSPFGIKIKIATGSRKLSEEFDILIGTHSVLNEKINFDKMGLVVIDEQQRFGVNQRGIIREKGKNAHFLTMTATPIPRTVALTMYGDLDLSYLSEMPHKRKQIKTWLVPPEKRNPGYAWIKKQIIQNKSQAFIICPFIEESESQTTIKAAKAEYERLQKQIFPDLRLGLLHGKMKAKEKDEALFKFRNKEFDILVSTPVVEVGIDIPNATIMMIEAAERFGLAQLHQLRGRVGRGEKQSYCLLFTDNEYAQNSKRLKGMETLYSGAELAELDLKLRGPGNIYGTLQHGIPKLKAASFVDTELIKLAKTEADRIFPNLTEFPELIKKIKSINYDTISPD